MVYFKNSKKLTIVKKRNNIENGININGKDFCYLNTLVVGKVKLLSHITTNTIFTKAKNHHTMAIDFSSHYS